ncbi:MAG: proline--tRNA ligase [Candidatus Omnitrophica bacterium]|nr:proline--tRNA ligase [Candidatus Omnitrophota bacterium]
MYWSKYFIPTLKETPIGTEAVSHQYLLRAGLIQMLTSGVYTYLPLGLRVLSNIEEIIREEMNAAGANELFMPCLHPLDIWKQTGRDKTLKDVMITFKDGKGRDMCLGPTHEEIITDVVRSHVRSYRQLPLTLYQIQTKFRDEMRPRFGIVRACEFIMKDAYSFDRDKAGLDANYQKMYEAYKKIFKRLGLDVVIVEADSGAMGGDLSHEFMVPAKIGEDEVEIDGKKQVAIELGHIFQLGTKYSEALGANFIEEDGKSKPLIMGCYGIGVSRVIAAIIEVHHDDKGIIWPREVAPFDVELLPIFKSANDETMILAREYYEKLTALGLKVLCDDRDDTAGRKFNDADLIGIPLRITIGQRNLAEGKVELKDRRTNEVILEDKNKIISTVQGLLSSV